MMSVQSSSIPKLSMTASSSKKGVKKRRKQKRIYCFLSKLCKRFPKESIKSLVLPAQIEERGSNFSKRLPGENSQSFALLKQDRKRKIASSPLLSLPKELRDEVTFPLLNIQLYLTSGNIWRD